MPSLTTLRRSLRAPALALMLTASLLSPALRAEVTRPAPGAAVSPARSTPPAFPDAVHVPEGCYISTLAYLAKFTAAFPGESASALVVHPKQYHGPHTVALVSWQNQWWVRDEYLGVLSLNQACTGAAAAERLAKKAATTIDQRTQFLSQWSQESIVHLGARVAAAIDAPRDVAKAAALLPCASEQFWVKCAGREIPLLFFRPAPGQIAVYDPAFGTASAETGITSGARVVELVARQFGYKVVSVRAHRAATVAALVR